MQLKQFGKHLWKRMTDHEIFDRAAQLSYYFLLALFPLLLFMMTLLGYFAGLFGFAGGEKRRRVARSRQLGLLLDR